MPQTTSTSATISAAAAHIALEGIARMYTYPEYAPAREYISNAIDAHILSGQTQPIEVNFTDQGMRVRDFGQGMDYETIDARIVSMDVSSKRGDGVTTGKYGMGAKSAFVVSDSLHIRSRIADGSAVLMEANVAPGAGFTAELTQFDAGERAAALRGFTDPGTEVFVPAYTSDDAVQMAVATAQLAPVPVIVNDNRTIDSEPAGQVFPTDHHRDVTIINALLAANGIKARMLSGHTYSAPAILDNNVFDARGGDYSSLTLHTSSTWNGFPVAPIVADDEAEFSPTRERLGRLIAPFDRDELAARRKQVIKLLDARVTALIDRVVASEGRVDLSAEESALLRVAPEGVIRKEITLRLNTYAHERETADAPDEEKIKLGKSDLTTPMMSHKSETVWGVKRVATPAAAILAVPAEMFPVRADVVTSRKGVPLTLRRYLNARYEFTAMHIYHDTPFLRRLVAFAQDYIKLSMCTFDAEEAAERKRFVTENCPSEPRNVKTYRFAQVPLRSYLRWAREGLYADGGPTLDSVEGYEKVDLTFREIKKEALSSMLLGGYPTEKNAAYALRLAAAGEASVYVPQGLGHTEHARVSTLYSENVEPLTDEEKVRYQRTPAEETRRELGSAISAMQYEHRRYLMGLRKYDPDAVARKVAEAADGAKMFLSPEMIDTTVLLLSGASEGIDDETEVSLSDVASALGVAMKYMLYTGDKRETVDKYLELAAAYRASAPEAVKAMRHRRAVLLRTLAVAARSLS